MTIRTIALDTETTGLGPEVHRLLELAALEFDPLTGVISTPYHQVVNPQRSVPAEAVAVHGWSDDLLADKPLFADVADSLLEFVEGAHVIIHNAPFDVGFLNAELVRAGKPKITDVVASITDTLRVSRSCVKAKSHTLDTLCDRYGIDKTKRVLHGALVDCELLAAVYPALVADSQRMIDLMNRIIPRPVGAAIPESLEDIVEAYLSFNEIISSLSAEQKRYTEAVRGIVQGLPQEGKDWAVQFQTRNTTDWAKVSAKHLAGVDLKPYIKQSAAMSIIRK